MPRGNEKFVFKEETSFCGPNTEKKFFINNKGVTETVYRAMFKTIDSSTKKKNSPEESPQKDSELFDYHPIVVALVTRIDGKNTFEIAEILNKEVFRLIQMAMLEGRKQTYTEVGTSLIRASGDAQKMIEQINEGEE